MFVILIPLHVETSRAKKCDSVSYLQCRRRVLESVEPEVDREPARSGRRSRRWTDAQTRTSGSHAGWPSRSCAAAAESGKTLDPETTGSRLGTTTWSLKCSKLRWLGVAKPLGP